MKISICGIPHDVIEKEDAFDIDCHFGMIDYKKCEIKLNANMTDYCKSETLCHEILQGILVHLGYNDLANDEQFVQAVGNAIYQSFAVRKIED